MGHLDEHKRTLPADGLQRALRAVREDDARALPRPQLHDRVMRAWDTRQQHRQTPRSGTLWLAAAAAVALVLVWASSQRRLDNGTSDAAAERAIAESSDGAVLFSTDVLMDDASSFQYVRLSLAPRTMAALGIPVVNPADDEPVAVEALIGLDGIPRSIRYTQVRQESQ